MLMLPPSSATTRSRCATCYGTAPATARPAKDEAQSARVEPECRESRLLCEHHVHVLDGMGAIFGAEGRVDGVVQRGLGSLEGYVFSTPSALMRPS